MSGSPTEVCWASQLRKSTGEGLAPDHSSESDGSHPLVLQLETDRLWDAYSLPHSSSPGSGKISLPTFDEDVDQKKEKKKHRPTPTLEPHGHPV